MAFWDIFGRVDARGSVRRRACALLLAALALGAPRGAGAQAVHNVHPPEIESLMKTTGGAIAGGRFRFEPWAGALWDAYRNDGGSGQPAWIGAARFGYELGDGFGPGFRLIGEVARAEATEAGTAVVGDSLEVEFATEWWLATAGLEYDVRGGWSGLTLEAQGGAAWITREVTGGDSIPAGTPGTTARAEAEPFGAARVGLSVWRHLTHSMQLRVRIEDVVTDPFDRIEHSPAVGVGVRFVFE